MGIDGGMKVPVVAREKQKNLGANVSVSTAAVDNGVEIVATVELDSVTIVLLPRHCIDDYSSTVPYGRK